MFHRSWMTATIVAVFAPLAVATPIADEPVENQIMLELQIAGLGREGCKVEIKPGHPGCQFEVISRELDAAAGARGLRIPVRARSTSADRDCSFAITIEQPGFPKKTYRRGLQLVAAPPDSDQPPTQALRCYLSSPSLARRDPTKPR